MTILHGDCLEVMAAMDANSVDAIVTDPPYELGFMGKKWDGTGIAFDPATWEACLRVLKPGGTMLAFGGSRTFHRIAVAIEDAGFQIKDTLCWLHGQGFPKGKAQLKPAFEPIIMARKPGSAVLQIDACRIEHNEPIRPMKAQPGGDKVYRQAGRHEPTTELKESGRWPANEVLDPESAGLLDAMSGERGGGFGVRGKSPNGRTYAGGKGFANTLAETGQVVGYGDTGGASRFFLTAPIDDPDAEHLRFMYTAKASRSERNAGLDGMPEREAAQRYGLTAGGNTPQQTPHLHRPSANSHPTIKPLALMRWLVRLVTPPGGTILDPFTGSGSTGCAAVLEGFDFIGIEQDLEYVDIARARIAHWTPKPEPQLILALEMTA
jgi:site-specific DNA-methyltransferase (adenine-specific)